MLSHLVTKVDICRGEIDCFDSAVKSGEPAENPGPQVASGGAVRELSQPDIDHPWRVGALAAPLRKRFGPALIDIAQLVRQTS